MSKQLDMKIVLQREIDGIEMGVMDDGTPFLTGRGLAKICGVAPSSIITLGAKYSPMSTRGRDKAITRILADHSYYEDSLYIRSKQGGKEVTAYPDVVCMAVLEYYAFEAEEAKPNALLAFRILGRKGLRDFIYDKIGYDPKEIVPAPWREFRDRLLLNSNPPGFYSVFSETANVVLDAIRNGLKVDAHVVPDISIGQLWSTYWKKNDLEAEYGDRQKEPHVYPDYFPQAKAEEIEAWTYPIDSLGRFRRWLSEEYLPTKYPSYIERQIKRGSIAASRAEMLIAMHKAPALSDGDGEKD